MTRAGLRYITALVILLCGCARGAQPGVFYLYVSPDGDDGNGGTENAPVRSLARANEILHETKPDRDVTVRLVSDRGPYVNETVRWTYYHPTHATVLEPYPGTRRAVFTADSLQPPTEGFFTFESGRGEPTNVTIRGLEVSRYVTRVFYFAGDRNNPASGWNGGNSIRDCVISGIGNERMPERHFVYGVITFVNSRRNTVSGCSISSCANNNSGGYPQNRGGSADAPYSESAGASLPIIGVYIAHHSSNNEIARNRFADFKGDCVRLRDASKGNVVRDNVFVKSDWAGICTAWYCNRRFDECTKTRSECPSYGNLLSNNTVRGNWLCETPTLYRDLQPEPSQRCDMINRTLQRRMRMDGNTLSGCEAREADASDGR